MAPTDGARPPPDDSDNDETSAPETEVKCDRPETETVGGVESHPAEHQQAERVRCDRCPSDKNVSTDNALKDVRIFE